MNWIEEKFILSEVEGTPSLGTMSLDRRTSQRAGLNQEYAKTHVPEARTSGDIDVFVGRLRNGLYARVLGYVPPLLFDAELPKTLREGVSGNLLTPDNLASALFNHDVRHHPGNVRSIQIAITAPNWEPIRSPHAFVEPDLVISFTASADLTTLGGQPEGKQERLYTLYTTRRNITPLVPRKLLGFALEFYNPEMLRTKRAVWLASRPADRRSTNHQIYDANARTRRSTGIGTAVERKAVLHPAQAGLPSLGKKAR